MSGILQFVIPSLPLSLPFPPLLLPLFPPPPSLPFLHTFTYPPSFLFSPFSSLSFSLSPPSSSLSFLLLPFLTLSSSLLPLSFLQSKTGHPLCSFENNSEYVYDIQWSPIHPALFASVDGEERLDFWNINVDTEVHAAQSVILQLK